MNILFPKSSTRINSPYVAMLVGVSNLIELYLSPCPPTLSCKNNLLPNGDADDLKILSFEKYVSKSYL